MNWVNDCWVGIRMCRDKSMENDDNECLLCRMSKTLADGRANDHDQVTNRVECHLCLLESPEGYIGKPVVFKHNSLRCLSVSSYKMAGRWARCQSTMGIPKGKLQKCCLVKAYYNNNSIRQCKEYLHNYCTDFRHWWKKCTIRRKQKWTDLRRRTSRVINL